MAGSSHTFNIKYAASHIFNLLITNFSLSTAWYQTLKIKRIKFVIAQTSQLLKLALSTLKIKKIKFTINNALVELLQNLPSTLKIKKISFVAIWHELYKIVQTVKIKKIKFGNTVSGVDYFKQLLRIATATIKIKKIKLIAYPTVAVFYTLSHWDTYLLSDLDALTLEDMDYNAT